MIYAHQQAASIAKHVSKFTAVLIHLGKVLKTEQAQCSSDLLHDIKRGKRSSRKKFEEIRAAIESKRSRPVQWLFRKSKAKELS